MLMRRGLPALLLLFGINAWAGTDLLDAWRAAQQHDPTFAAAQAEHRAGQQKRRQGRAMLLPRVQLGAGLGLTSLDNRTSGAEFTAPGFGTSDDVEFLTNINRGHSERWALSAQQPLYNAERFAGAKQLNRQAKLADVQYSAAQQDLMLRVAQGYLRLLLAEDTRALLAAQKDAAQRAQAEAQARFEHGDVSITDVNEAQARFDAVAAQQLAADSDVQLQRTVFTDLTGLAPLSLQRPPADMPVAPETGTLADWQQRAAAGNPLLEMQLLGLDIARAEIDKYRALTAPTLDLVAQIGEDRLHGDGNYGTSHINSSGWAVGLQLNVPIFTGGLRSAKRDEAAALAEKARYDVDAARQQVAQQTQAAWLGVTTGAARVRALQQAQRSARSRLQSTQLGRKVGARSTLDLLNAQTDFYGAERALREAQYNWLLSRLRLAAMAGELGETQLGAVNTALRAATPSDKDNAKP